MFHKKTHIPKGPYSAGLLEMIEQCWFHRCQLPTGGGLLASVGWTQSNKTMVGTGYDVVCILWEKKTRIGREYSMYPPEHSH